MQHDDEIRLVLEAVAGSAEAFGTLTDRYSRVLLGLAYTYTGDLEAARDIVQESLLKSWLSLGTLHRPERFGSWLRQIAVNLARDYLRRQYRHETVPLADWDGAAHGGEDLMDRQLLRDELLKHLEAVPEGPRTALVLHYLMGLSPVEAAAQLGISRASFDTRLSRGREALRRELNQLMNEALTTKQAEAQVYLEGLSARIRAALHDGPRERAVAARELALLAARANLNRLALDLTNPDESARQTAARLIAETGDRRMIPHLLPLLATEEEPAVLAEVCRSLARLGAAEAIDRLKHLSRQTADMAVHKAASEAVCALESSGEPVADGDIAVSVEDLRQAGIEGLLLAMLEDPSPQVRTHAADGLGRVESVKALPALVSVLENDAVEYVRLTAAAALGAIAGRHRQRPAQISVHQPACVPAKQPARIPAKEQARVVDALVRALTDSYHGTVAEAARSLALIDLTPAQRDRVVEALFAAIPDLLQRKPGAWWATLPLLFGHVGGEAEMVRLAEIRLHNPAPIHNGPLANALEQMAAPGRTAANGLMLAALAEERRDPSCLLRALGRTRDPEVAGPVAAFLAPGASRMPKVWSAAAEALAQMPDGAALLMEAVEDGLAGYTARSGESGPVGSSARDAARTAGLPGGKLDEGPLTAAVETLERIGGPQVAEWLEANAERFPPRVRIKAMAAARRISRAEAVAGA